MFDQWDDLMLTGVFKPREALLRGLSLEQVSAVPTGAPHSIYQELWHATTVLRMSLDQGRVALETWPYEQHFPERHGPAGQAQWEELVAAYLSAAQELVRRSQDDGWLTSADPGYEEHGLTWRDAAEFLAVHSAYHLGRVVLLRQLLGAWPPAR